MPAHIEQLPAGASSQTGVIAFVPAEGEENARSPVAGVLVIVLGRVKCTYRVEEFPADLGRGFQLVKMTGGSDAEEWDYSVYCARGEAPRCECKGYVRWGGCKHARAISVCLAKKWL